jgi:hypothetical protein
LSEARQMTRRDDPGAHIAGHNVAIGEES